MRVISVSSLKYTATPFWWALRCFESDKATKQSYLDNLPPERPVSCAASSYGVHISLPMLALCMTACHGLAGPDQCNAHDVSISVLLRFFQPSPSMFQHESSG
mmetsp:Transcript_18827/g.42771  ORF Transcript_18827/g.42771 Transcript_18827/m.42771 type:complete len:103 (+) Transcript_18827:96-404(+)